MNRVIAALGTAGIVVLALSACSPPAPIFARWGKGGPEFLVCEPVRANAVSVRYSDTKLAGDGLGGWRAESDPFTMSGGTIVARDRVDANATLVVDEHPGSFGDVQTLTVSVGYHTPEGTLTSGLIAVFSASELGRGDWVGHDGRRLDTAPC